MYSHGCDSTSRFGALYELCCDSGPSSVCGTPNGYYSPNTREKQFLEGRTGEYAEATADEFLEDWLKTDADRAREASAASAAAVAAAAATAAAVAGSPSAKSPHNDRSKQGGRAGPTDAVVAGEHGGAGRRSSGTPSDHSTSRGHAAKNKRRSSHANAHGHDHGEGRRHHGHHHHDRQRGGGGGGGGKHHRFEKGPPRSRGSTRSTEGSDSEEGRSGAHAAAAAAVAAAERGAVHGLKAGGGGGGGGGDRHDTRGPGGRRRKNAGGPPADHPEPAAEHGHRRNRAEKKYASSVEPSSSPNKGNRAASIIERGGAQNAGTGQGGGAPKEGPETWSTSPQDEDEGEDGSEEQKNLRRAVEDAAQLRATVEQLKSELNSVKIGAEGDAFGSGVGHGRIPFGGPPWMAGGMTGGMTGGTSRILPFSVAMRTCTSD